MKFTKRMRVRFRRFFGARPRGVGEKRAEQPWRRLNVKRVSIGVGTFVALSLLVTPSQFYRRPQLTEGAPANVDVVAPYRFPVEKDRPTLKREMDEAGARVLPVFRENESIAGIAADEQREFFVIIRQLADTYAMKNAREREAFLDELSIDVSRETLQFLLEADQYEKIRGVSAEVLAALFREGILDVAALNRRGYGKTLSLIRGEGQGENIVSADELLSPLSAVRRARDLAAAYPELDAREATAAAEIAALNAKPNILYDDAETERRRRAARDAVAPLERWVEEGEKIVERNRAVTADQIRAVNALYSSRTRKNLIISFAGRSLLVAVVLAVLGVFFNRYRSSLYRQPRYWWMVSVVLVASCFVSRAFVVFLGGYSPASVYIFATCLGAMLITLLIDVGFGFIAGIALAILAGVMGGVALKPALVAAASATVGVFLIARLRRRSDFYKSFAGMVAAATLATVGLGLIDMAPWEVIGKEIWWAAVLSAASVVVLAMLLPIFEMTFQVVTDLKLLELGDLNQPLLRDLLLEAPGTYHHSIIVGSLAESAAAAVGANSLLARVASYYHDIGKLRAPAYFAENSAGEVHSHEHLSPQMSTLVVASHTKQGARMADEAGLPPAILDVIAEHHGTGLISFFYQAALKMDEHKVLEEDNFRYPGPKPRSKVAAIVMLADAVESASRSLEQPTPTSIRSLVEKIISARRDDGQLDESELTLREIQVVKESLIKGLNSVFHIRPTYPDDAEPYVIPYLSTHSAETKSN
jgi:putative nucleotidyltransferase with HDIG domain